MLLCLRRKNFWPFPYRFHEKHGQSSKVKDSKKSYVNEKVCISEMNISRKTTQRIFTDDLGLTTYKKRTGYYLTNKLETNKVVKSKQLPISPRRLVANKILCLRIIFFTIQQYFKKQNLLVYNKRFKEDTRRRRRIKWSVGYQQRGHYPTSVTV